MTQSIVLTVCAAHGIAPEVFFGRSQNQKVVACRRAAIAALLNAGFSMKGCSRLMRRNYSTITYWCRDEWREKRREKARAYHRRVAGEMRV